MAWLLDAEERFTAAEAIGTDVIVVKDQFHAHEDFMMQLTDHQNHVGNVLQEGSQLIFDGKLTEEEEGEVRLQMSLLNSRWEDLRLKAMERQSRYVLVTCPAIMSG